MRSSDVDPDRWRRIDSLPTPRLEERRVLLDEVCAGNEALRTDLHVRGRDAGPCAGAPVEHIVVLASAT